jgi:hypothetical protein
VPIERVAPKIAIPGARPGSPAARAVGAHLARLAPNSRRAVLGRLRAVATVVASPRDGVAWHALGYVRLAQLRDQLQANGMTPPMINLTLIILRGIAAAAADIGHAPQPDPSSENCCEQGAAGARALLRHGVCTQSVPKLQRLMPGRRAADDEVQMVRRFISSTAPSKKAPPGYLNAESV